jgi:hypothetical protein
VLRLLDARTGLYAEVRSAYPGLLRVCAHAPLDVEGSDIKGQRVLLVADLLARTAELRGLQVLIVLAFTSGSSEQARALERAADALGIHPPAARAGSPDAQTSLGGAIDIHVVSQSASVDGDQIGPVVLVGAARMRQAGEAAAGDVLTKHRQDPLAVRLALMSFPYHQSAELTEAVLTSARETLGHWRHQVAEWAESPSRPIPARITEAAQAAFGDLDTVSALALLRSVALDASVPAGARFETFVYADRILGLDLAREIGRPRG